MNFKEYVLKSGLYNIYVCYRHYLYYLNYRSDVDMPLDYMPYMSFSYYEKYQRLWKVCSRLYSSRSSKVRRIKKRFILMYKQQKKFILFLTLTFTDDVLAKTSVKTRRTYVQRFLKGLKGDYVANIDFGDLNDREHYHGVIAIDEKLDFKDWRYGIINFQQVPQLVDDSSKIALYIDKLTNHAVKDSAGRLLYSRGLVDTDKMEYDKYIVEQKYLQNTLCDDSDLPF